MAKAPRHKKGKTPAPTNSTTKTSTPTQHVYCVVCRRSCTKHQLQEHEHGMLHHKQLESVLGEQSIHECQACKASSMGLKEYARHISTPQHKAKFKIMIETKIKPIPLLKTLGEEAMGQIMQRHKTLKRAEQKAWRKEKKKQMAAGQTCVDKLQEKKLKKEMKLEISKQWDMRTRQRETYKQESTVRDQFTQSAQQLEYDDNFSVKIESSPTARHVRKPCNTKEGITKKPGQPCYTANRNNYYDKQYDAEFTSDHLPHNGAIIFGHGQSESTPPPKPGPSTSAHPAPAIGSANATPVRDVDVRTMLRQIRRALGVREPCRADREARKQNGDAGLRVADPSTTQQAGAEKEQPTGGSSEKRDKEASLRATSAAATVPSSQVDIPASTPNSGSCPSDIAPHGPKQRTQGTTKQWEKSSVLLSNSGEQESQGPLDSQCLSASSEPNVNIARKVRIAHRSANVQGGKEAESTATMSKLFSLSGAKNKPNWREMYTEMKRKKQETGKGMPRFGIELTNPPSGKESSTQEIDTTLSEGFHWESMADGPSGARRTELRPPLQNTTRDDSRAETQSDPRTPEPLEQLDAAQERYSRQTAGAVFVKVEGNLEDVYGDSGANSSATKKKRKTHGGISDKEPSGKKKKTKPNKDQGPMDQLLAVSLREDELSHSLQDLDQTLVQARSTLQAAYTEVQRLMLMRQQITAEVNSLRTQRIEILQGMQGGYTGAEKATTSSAGALAAVQPRHSPLPFPSAFPTSFSQQPSPSHRTPSISPTALPTMSVKQEIVQQSVAGKASQSAKTVSGNSDTLQQPVLPSDLLPSLLPPSPCLAAPTTAVTALKQLTPECATSPKTNPLTESSARPETVTLADSDSEEEVRRNLCIEKIKEKLKAATKSVSTVDPKSSQSASAAPPDKDGGNVSDASVEMMEPSDLVVIDIDESDSEDASNVPVHQEPPQQSVNVEFTASSTQTRQQNDVQRIVQKTPVPVKDASVPECVDIVEDEEPSVGAFLNHKGPVHGLHIHEGLLYTCSGDNTARAYSLKSRECQAVFEGHTNKVNCLLVSSSSNVPARLYTGSSDQTIRCFSIKTTKCLEQVSLSDRVLCMHISWHILYAGLANGSVASCDLKTLKHMDVFECHGPRGVSCLGTSQEGARRVLLVGSYDSSISVRDAKSGLLLRTLEGHTKTVLCMKVVNDLVFTGSSDTSVHAHNIHTGELVRIYKGHAHAVTSIVILGKVMVTACLDKLVRVYELQSHDRLQVYGGHSDMVMCMAVHKSVVYTGCYDGSVQAVKLNLMKNYRCWWQNCSLIFGLVEHLLQHLVRDHSNSNQEAVKCRWRGCKAFFGTQQSIRQKLPEHMQGHVDNDSKVQP